MKYIKVYLYEEIKDNPTEFQSDNNDIEYNIGEKFLTVYTKTSNYIFPLAWVYKIDKN